MKSKLFYSIGEVSEYTKVPPHTIRYWENRYNLLRPEKDSRGRRRYTKSDIDLIKKINELVYEKKYKTESIKKKIKEDRNIDTAEKLTRNKIFLIKQELESILEIVNR